jgi:alkanesulfonate monooxygenase SsuD/methylene tetrahydromethanopterin reductase-like flavin-dependent oxidoreductase (luciferase family)
VLQGLEQGYIEYSGKYVNVPRRQIRPAPVRSFRDRTFGAAISPESLEQMADLGSGLVIIPQKPWEVVQRELVNYRARFQDVQGRPAPKPVIAVHFYVDRDTGKATELGQRNNQMYYHRVMEMYGLAGSHLKDTKGYEYYGKTAKVINDAGPDKAAEHYANLHVYGDPRQCLEKIEWIRETVDTDHLVCFFAYGGFSYEQSRASLALFDEEIRPVLQQDRAFSATAG